MAPLSVLVLDDDADLRIILRLLLEDVGYDVHEAANAEQALVLLHAAPQPFVVLLDLALRKDETRILTDPRLRAVTTGTPLASSSPGRLLRAAQADPMLARHCYIAVTALPQSQIAPGLRDLLAATCPAVVIKPFDLEEVLAVVQQGKQRLVAPVHAARRNYD